MSSPKRSISTSASPAVPRGGYIAGAAFDGAFFIFSPLWALALGLSLGATPLAREGYRLYGRPESLMSLFSGVFTMAHLFIVFFRSHGNPGVFRLYPRRFILAPILLFAAMALSSWVLIFVFVLAVWWDVYHSSLQTFGLGRIYDLRAGNDPEAARSPDRALNLVLYIGPVFAGLSLADHLVHFGRFADVGTPLFARIPDWAESNKGWIRVCACAVSASVAVWYVWRLTRLRASGYRMPWQKAALFVSTAVCSLWAWGFNPYGQAFFIMNFFHALQYFAIIWWSEGERMRRRLGRFAFAAPFTLIAVGSAYGGWAKFLGESDRLAFSLLLVVSIMHFWYDGFIWSVRKGQVAGR